MYQILSRKLFLPPANEVWGKVIFLHLFVILFTGGGHAWLLLGGGMHGCSWGGACMVVPGGGHAWLLWGGAWLLRGVLCVVAPGGAMHGCSGGGGHAWDTTRYGDTINERALRILLECILVNNDLKELGCCTNYFVFLSTEERLDIFNKNASCTGKA